MANFTRGWSKENAVTEKRGFFLRNKILFFEPLTGRSIRILILPQPFGKDKGEIMAVIFGVLDKSCVKRRLGEEIQRVHVKFPLPPTKNAVLYSRDNRNKRAKKFFY